MKTDRQKARDRLVRRGLARYSRFSYTQWLTWALCGGDLPCRVLPLP